MIFALAGLGKGTYGVGGTPLTLANLMEFPTSVSGSTYSVFNRTVEGLVPAPGGATLTRYLREDGTWGVPPDTDNDTIYTHPNKTWVNKTNLTSNWVISNLSIDALGHLEDWVTRQLTAQDVGAEPALGNPATDGYILSSTAAGQRSWIPAPTGGGGGGTYTPPTQQPLTDAATIVWNLEQNPLVLLQATAAVGATRTFPNDIILTGQNGREYSCTFVNDTVERSITYGDKFKVIGEMSSAPNGRTIISIKVQGDEADVVHTVIADNPATGIADISVQDQSGNEQFKVTDHIKFENVEFDAILKKIRIAQDPLVADTVFVNFSGGNDTTGLLENINKPFKTFEAAHDAIPTTKTDYTIILLNNGTINSIARTSGVSMDLTVLYNGTGTLTFNNCIGTAGSHIGPLRIYAPRATFSHINAAGGSFGASLTLTEITFKHIVIGTNGGNSGFFKGRPDSQEYNFVRCRTMQLQGSGFNIIGMDGELVISETLTLHTDLAEWCNITGNGVNTVFLSIKKIQKNNTRNFGIFTGNRSVGNRMKIETIEGTGGGITFIRSYGGGVDLDFDKLYCNPLISLSICSSYSGTTNFYGVMDDRTDAFSYNHGSGNGNFVNFKGQIQTITGGSNISYRFNNSTIKCPTSLFANNQSRNLIRFDNHNTIEVLDGSPIFTGLTSVTQDVIINGTLKTTASSMGVNTNVINTALSLKEKSKEIVVRNKIDLINKPLDSSAIYIVDGDLALNGFEHIIVPPGGLSIQGYSFDASRLGSYGVPNHRIFTSGAYSSLIDRQGNGDAVTSRTELRSHLNTAADQGLIGQGVKLNRTLDSDVLTAIPQPTFDAGVPFSFGFWVKLETGNEYYGCIASAGGGRTSSNTFSIHLQGGTNFRIWARGIQTAISALTYGVFGHIEVVWDGAVGTLYFNGTPYVFNVGTAAIQTSYPNIFLGRRGDNGEHLGGVFDNIYYYNRARTQPEVVASYNGGAGLTYEQEDKTGLVHFYDCEDDVNAIREGSGNLVLHNIAFTTTGENAGVFDIKDIDGSHALEMITVNFEGCKTIGEIYNYRQGTGITIGFYGNANGLTLDGAWNGFKLTNTNGFSFGENSIMFKAGSNLTFRNRFYLEINVDIPATAAISDVAPTNFLSPKLFQVNTTLAKVAGVLDPANTSILFPNILPTDPEALFTDNIGIKNSPDNPYGIATANLEVAANDAAAATQGVPVGSTYIESSTGYFKVRLA